MSGYCSKAQSTWSCSNPPVCAQAAGEAVLHVLTEPAGPDTEAQAAVGSLTRMLCSSL